jgi:hypothetical protein
MEEDVDLLRHSVLLLFRSRTRAVVTVFLQQLPDILQPAI